MKLNGGRKKLRRLLNVVLEACHQSRRVTKVGGRNFPVRLVCLAVKRLILEFILQAKLRPTSDYDITKILLGKNPARGSNREEHVWLRLVDDLIKEILHRQSGGAGGCFGPNAILVQVQL